MPWELDSRHSGSFQAFRFLVDGAECASASVWDGADTLVHVFGERVLPAGVSEGDTIAVRVFSTFADGLRAATAAVRIGLLERLALLHTGSINERWHVTTSGAALVVLELRSAGRVWATVGEHLGHGAVSRVTHDKFAEYPPEGWPYASREAAMRAAEERLIDLCIRGLSDISALPRA